MMSSSQKLLSRIKTAYFACFQYAGAGSDEGGCALTDLMLLRYCGNRGVSGYHHGFKSVIAFVFGPVEAGEVLHPFEIADGDTAGIGQHIRDDQGSSDARRVGKERDSTCRSMRAPDN